MQTATPAVLANPDFEAHLGGLTPLRGGAAAGMEAVAWLMAWVTPVGWPLFVPNAGHLVARGDADAMRQQAADRGVYHAATVARLPWNSGAEPVVAYAQDARAGALGCRANPQVTRQVNSKAFSHRHAADAGLEPGAFAFARKVHSTDELAEHLAEVPEDVARQWVLKPLWGFAGGGRLTGAGRSPPNDSKGRLAALLKRDGAVLFEPWVQRTGDFSTQMWVSGPGRVAPLCVTRLLTTPSGRYMGTASTAPEDAATVHALREGASAAANWLAHAGYTGPAGVDALAFTDPVDGRSLLRPVVEINARFTLGLLASTVADMAAASGAWPAGSPWTFVLDPRAPPGRWTPG